MNNIPHTHNELYLMFLKSVEEICDSIKKKNSELKKNKDYDEITQLHNTKSLIKRWFFDEGRLPI